MKPTAIVTIILSLASLVGCAMQQDVVALNDRLYALERRNASLERENSQLRSRVEDATRIREEKDQSFREQSAGLEARFDRIREEIQKVSGRLEETEHLVKEVQRYNKDFSERLSRLEQSGGRPSTDMAPPPSIEKPTESFDTPAPPAAASASKRDIGESELYEASKQAFDRDDLETARKGFKELIQKFPKSPRADSAQFWIGETYFREKEYERAIAEYQTVIEKYPRGNKVPSALLKQGISFAFIGDKNNARIILKELVSKYPDSNEAKIANQKLKGL